MWVGQLAEVLEGLLPHSQVGPWCLLWTLLSVLFANWIHNFRPVWTCEGSWWTFQQHDVSFVMNIVSSHVLMSCSGHLVPTLVLPQCVVDLLRAMAVVLPIERLWEDFMKSQKTQLRLHCIVSLFALVYLTSKRLSNMSILVCPCRKWK